MNKIFCVIFAISLMVASEAFSSSAGRVVPSRTILHSEAPEASVGFQPADAAAISESDAPVSKGFGAPKQAKADEPEEKDAGTMTYEAQQKRGIPEYNIFLRPKGGEATDWVPVGSMTIPRDTKVGKAVYEVEDELLKGTLRIFPKLKAYYETRKDKGDCFEYGWCLKAFPDEEIRLVEKEAIQEETGFFKNWLNRITNPMDTEDLKLKGQMTLKQK